MDMIQLREVCVKSIDLGKYHLKIMKNYDEKYLFMKNILVLEQSCISFLRKHFKVIQSAPFAITFHSLRPTLNSLLVITSHLSSTQHNWFFWLGSILQLYEREEMRWVTEHTFQSSNIITTSIKTFKTMQLVSW